MTVKEVFCYKADLYGREMMERECLEKSLEIRKTVIGRSILGREIPAYFIGSGRYTVLLVGAHHALESIGTNFLFLMLNCLSDAREFNRFCRGFDRKALLSVFSFVLVPCLNPDGVELRFHGASESPLRERQLRMSGGDFSSWQANSRGVDLNHNYDAGFFRYKRIEAERGIIPGPTLYSGEYPESEPEVKALCGLIRVLNPSLSVSLHTQGEEVYFSEAARFAAEALSKRSGYRVAKAEGTAAYGGMTDYLDKLGLASLTVELGKGVNPLPEESLGAIAERILSALITLPTVI